MRPPLILASSSPRRTHILRLMGIPHKVVPSRKVDETARAGEGPRKLVFRLALAKAREVSRRHPKAVVLGADTVVVHRGRIHGKPVDRAGAERMLRTLFDGDHEVVTGVAIVRAGGRSGRVRVERSRVLFGRPSRTGLRRYLDSREPYDKAGGYDLRGTARSWIRGWKGEAFTILGLPLRWLLPELRKCGIRAARTVTPVRPRRS